MNQTKTSTAQGQQKVRPSLSDYFASAVAKVYIVSFRAHAIRYSTWRGSIEGPTFNRGSTNPPRKPSR
jgi:hypothetical protein